MPAKGTRISEADLKCPALRALAMAPNGEMSTSELIEALEVEFQPTGEDAEILNDRNDTRFSQIVRNIVSHKDMPGNLIAEGLVVHIGPRKGLRITDAGRAYLQDHC